MSDFDDKPPAPYLDPINQNFLDQAAATNTPPFEDLSVARFRELFHQLQDHKPIVGVSVTEFNVSFKQHNIENIKTYIFKPEGKEKESLPAAFYLHGGGWIAGKYDL